MCKSNLHGKAPLVVCKCKVMSDDRLVFRRLMKQGSAVVTLELALTKCQPLNDFINNIDVYNIFNSYWQFQSKYDLVI